MAMRFEAQTMLWLLLIVPPALVAFLWWTWRQRERLLTRFIEPRLLAGLTAGLSPRRRRWKLGFIVVAVGLLLVTLARPQWGYRWEESRQMGLDIVVAIDTSKSMLADDIAPNRLTRAKLAALDLMQLAQSDRLGLAAFAGSAFLMCPLTIDDGAFRQCVDALDVETIPSGGTALAEAIDTARTAFKEDDDSHKVLVLFSDGEDHDDRALAAAEAAAAAGLRIFTIGIGTPEGEMLRIKDAKGRTDFVRDEAGNVVKSRLNEPLLQEIARVGNGFYLPLRGARTMDTLYADGLAPLPKSESEARLVKRFHERYHGPLALATLLLLAELFLRERRRPARTPAAAAPAPLAAAGAAAALLCLLAAPSAHASVTTAQRAFEAGRYEEALREYEALLRRRADDPRLFFNAGIAAYRDGQFAEAGKLFEQALTAPDLKLQQPAYYNRGNTHFRIGERADELPRKREAWQQALKDFEAAIKLDEQDVEARNNHEYVRRRLEELEQQQQQQQQQQDQQSEPQDQDQQQPQDQQQQDQSQQQQQNQEQQGQGQEQDQQDQQQQQQQGGQDEQERQRQEQERQQREQAERERQQQQQQQEQDRQDQQSQSGEGREGEDGGERRVGLLTPQQARQILDALKSEEKMLPADIQKPPERPGSPRSFRDW